MSFQPLFQNDKSGEIILNFSKNELLPITEEIEKLAVKISDYRVDYWGSIFRKKMLELDSEFRSTNKKLLSLYHKYSTPDELFKDINDEYENDPRGGGMIMADYFVSQKSVMPHFNRSFSLMQMIDNRLTRNSQSADQRVGFTLSLLAITIAIIVGISQIN